MKGRGMQLLWGGGGFICVLSWWDICVIRGNRFGDMVCVCVCVCVLGTMAGVEASYLGGKSSFFGWSNYFGEEVVLY